MLNDLAPHAWPARSTRSDFAWVTGLFFALGFLSIVLARQPGSIATIWLANGAATALIASAPASRALLLLAGVGLANLAANLAWGDPLSLSLAFIPPNVAEVALGVTLIRRSQMAEHLGANLRAFLMVLLLGAIVPPLLGATLGAATLQALDFAPFSTVWIDWYIGGVLGASATLALVLILRAGTTGTSLRRLAEPSNLFTLAVVALATAGILRYIPFPFVAIGMLLMAVAFTQPRVTAFAASLVAAIVLTAMLAYGKTLAFAGVGTWHHAVFYIDALLAIVPAQAVAIVIGVQRTMAHILAAVESRVDVVAVFADVHGIVRWVNRAREAYWGQPAIEVLGRHWSQNIPQTAYEGSIRPAFEAACEGRTTRYLIDYDYPMKGRRTTDFQMQPAYDDDGHLIGVLYSGTDVTELDSARRELEATAEQLREANRRLEQFVRIASHDLREPLNTVLQFCNLIRDGQADRLDDQGRLFLDHVHKGASRMRLMLDDVLQFVRLEEAQPLPAEPVDLDALVQEVRSALQASIDASGAHIEVQPLGQTWGRASLLSLVLQNLVSNAIKFVAPGTVPQISVTAQRDDHWLRLAVSDNGIGIGTDKLSDLGTPFRRLHARRKYEGTGLGLAIAKRIARQHGGRIEIASTEGLGSRFTLVLPLEPVDPTRLKGDDSATSGPMPLEAPATGQDRS